MARQNPKCLWSELLRGCRVHGEDGNKSLAKEDGHSREGRDADRISIVGDKIALGLRRDHGMQFGLPLGDDPADRIELDREPLIGDEELVCAVVQRRTLEYKMLPLRI